MRNAIGRAIALQLYKERSRLGNPVLYYLEKERSPLCRLCRRIAIAAQ
ncbi:MAG: hypothetical protein F6J93_20650 [Oscillatoria sp. SIO1A7]|nr:hypothetical protein [Oscillatoria sp. SIO1A7]